MSPDVPPSTFASLPTPTINTGRTPEPPLPSSSSASTSVVTAPVPTTTVLNPNIPTNTHLVTANTSNVDSVHTCSHCDRTFISRIGPAGHLRIYRTETGEAVPGAPTYIRCIRLYSSYCPSIFAQCMGLLGHVRIHESGINGSLQTRSASCASTTPSPTHTLPRTASSSIAVADIYCPHCPAHSLRTSAWSITCESIAQGLANQCLEHQHTPDTPTSTALTAPAHSPAA
nr:unnamed protein product [Spirometra erinaceieuropaei]